MITLYHHPFSRAAGTVWALEEVGQPYQLEFVDIRKGAQKAAAHLALNPMGKLPVLRDGDTVVTEAAAIAMYLGDRYASGSLAPAFDDPARGTYLRWICFAPSVIEPAILANANKWTYTASQAGWGELAHVLDAMEAAIGKGPFLLGDRFTMADVIFGGTIRFMLRFGQLEKRPAFTSYVERLDTRPALQRSDAKNMASMKEHGIQ